MHPDQPGPADMARRGPLDDLRERLARLPPSHPSSPEYGFQAQPDQEDAPPDQEDAAPDQEDAAPDQEDAAPDQEDAAGAGQLDRGDERPASDRPGVLRPGGRPARLVDRARPGAPADVVSPGPGESYRPWFSSGESPQPWFSADPRDRSG